MSKQISKPHDYTELSAELAELLKHLQTGDLEIDAAVEQYTRGIQIIKLLEDQLRTAENKVHVLKESLEADQPIVVPRTGDEL